MGVTLFIIVFPTACLGGKDFTTVEQFLQKQQNVTEHLRIFKTELEPH